MHRLVSVALGAALLASASWSWPSADPQIALIRVPAGGIQPAIALDASGMLHMVYLADDPAAADVYYVRSRDEGKTFSPPVRVNSQVGSAIATGTIRGAEVAIGRSGRVHVAWNGSGNALPKPPAGAPMLYARSNADATAFEPQRNLITKTRHLDGGGSIAADGSGRVFVAWHGNASDGDGGEQARRVWIARSNDDGATFTEENPVSDRATGVCGCCALRLAATPAGELHLLYRSARDTIHRDIYSLTSRDGGRTFAGARLHPWEIGACPMTSMSIVAGEQILRTWETDGQVYFNSSEGTDPLKAPPEGEDAYSRRRKHPRLAVNSKGEVLLAWTEGTLWGRGGSLAWQMFAADGRPLPAKGRKAAVPVWSFGAVAARRDNGFTIFY